MPFVSSLERLIYASLLLSADAVHEPTATDTAVRVVELLEAGESTRLRDERLSSTPLRRATHPKWREVLAIVDDLGPVLEVVPIKTTRLEGRFRVVAERGDWELWIAILEDGTITRFLGSEFRPPVRESPPLALPVRGEWQVFGGGATSLDRRSARRAVDLGIADRQGDFHHGSGLENRDYYSYGQPIHSMARGQVVMVVEGVPDNEPGKPDNAYKLGNVVIVQHQADLFSVYGHLRPGRMKVKPGDFVQSGQVLGECGNSGDSRLPHLHVHVQDGPIPDEAWGMKAIFADAIVEREGVRTRMTNVSLVNGDLVSSTLPEPAVDPARD